MKKIRKLKSRPAAVENVKRLFANSPDEDSISLKDAFASWGRPNSDDVEVNKAWLSNMLYHLKYHNLLTPVYSFGSGRKKLEKLQLTYDGKEALGRLGNIPHDPDVNPSTNHTASSIDVVMKMLPNIRKEHPEFDIIFEVKPKER